MADIFSKSKRSKIMSAIRGSGNKETELKLIEIFKEKNIIGWRRNNLVFGKPDFVFPKIRLAVFVDGCFWHGCSKCYRRPNSNQKYWDDKFIANRLRDKRVNKELKKMGWKTIRIWEHQLRQPNKVAVRISKWFSKSSN